MAASAVNVDGVQGVEPTKSLLKQSRKLFVGFTIIVKSGRYGVYDYGKIEKVPCL